MGAAGKASQGDIKDLKNARKEPMEVPGARMSQAESIPYAKALGGRDLTWTSSSKQAGQDGEARRKVKGDGRKKKIR